MRFLNTILDIIFPIHCISCGKTGTNFCFECLANCGEAERENPKWIFSLFDYRNPSIKRSIHLLKYKGKRNLAKTFAEIMHGRINEELSELAVLSNFHKIILIPIPLANKRRKERGFNQAELICKNLLKLNNKNNLNKKDSWTLEKNILKKPKETVHQAKIENRSERLKNIVGSFSIKNSELIKDRNIILIDDVTTTGATLTEARKVLKEAGAKKIIAFTIAH